VVIGEVGWPSEGRTKNAAEPSLANEAYFTRNFVQLSLNKGYDYYIVEAYDQPWKVANEGTVGAYWGLFEAGGRPKFAFTGLLRSFPEWRIFMLGAAFLTLLLGLFILGRMPRVHQTGYIVMGGLVAVVSTGLLLVIDATTLDYIDAADIAMIMAMSPLVFLASTVILTEGIELASSLWRLERRTLRASIPEASERVSVHVPCYNEPPAMVIETLSALARLDYENYEVIVLDNNTPDPETWLPVQAHCAALGARFRFYHFDEVQGFKRARSPGAGIDRPGSKVRRCDRQRLSRRAQLAAPGLALFRRAGHRGGAGPAGLQRRLGQPVQGDVLSGI